MIRRTYEVGKRTNGKQKTNDQIQCRAKVTTPYNFNRALVQKAQKFISWLLNVSHLVVWIFDGVPNVVAPRERDQADESDDGYAETNPRD